MRVMLVKNDEQEAESITSNLMRHGYEITTAHTGAEALDFYQEAEIILLDLDLPDIDGLEVCQRIRRRSMKPIITLTAQGDPMHRVLSLRAGSDDCVEQPYHFHELLARMDSVMRRMQRDSEERRQADALDAESVSIGEIFIDPTSRKVQLNELDVKLTRKEFDLLLYLARNPGAVVSRQELMLEVWHYKSTRDMNMRASRTIDTHINSLRNKIGRTYIDTVHGIGFRISH